MKWYKVSVETTTESIEAVAEILSSVGANGVEIEDAADFKGVTMDQIGPFGEVADLHTLPHLDSGAKVTAYFPETSNLPEIVSQIKNHLALLPTYGLPLGSGVVNVADLDDQDWANAWKKYYHPTRVTRFLTVVPQWLDYQPQAAEEVIVRLDPGMSFGTGTHPTTVLALTALEKVIRGGETVFDVGTGSGILSIVASKLGAKTIEACDLDQVAVDAAKANVALNEDMANIHVFPSNLLKQVTGKADLILANILAEIIELLIPDLQTHLKPHGKVILSGIIDNKLDSVCQTLQAHHFEVVTQFQEKEWIALVVQQEVEA